MRLEDQPDTKLMTMPLYRSGFFRVIQFTDSRLAFTAQEKKVPVFNNCLSFSYPGKLESWERQGRLYGTVIYFTEAFAGLDTTLSSFDSEYPYFTFEGDVLLPLEETETELVKKQSEEMIGEMYSNLPDKLSMIQKLLAVYLHQIRRLYNDKMNAQPGESKASQALFNRFRKVIDDYFQQLAVGKKTVMPSVSIVADVLGVSSNYLNETIKNVTGQTVSAHLQRKMVLEIKSYLLHSEAQVAQIAYRLGFENVPYFNRFFKKHTGQTPLEFRNLYRP